MIFNSTSQMDGWMSKIIYPEDNCPQVVEQFGTELFPFWIISLLFEEVILLNFNLSAFIL